MPRATRTIGATVLLTMLALAVPPAVADDFDDCSRAQNLDDRVRACTAVVASSAFAPEQKALAYRNRGRARVEAGALDAALADLDQAILLNPNDHQAYAYRALTRMGRGDFDGAIVDYTTVIRLRPGSAIGYNGRGHANLVKQSPRAAIDDFSMALQHNPRSATTLNNRGLAYKQAGELTRAIDDYTQAIALNPIYAIAYNNRGYAHEAAGHRAEALADYRHAILLDPSLVGAKDGLGRLGNPREVISESEALILEGRTLVEKHCAPCHAIGTTGVSPHRSAPPFRTLHSRHPMQALREPLARGIAAPHDEMPKFRLQDSDVDRVVAYINSLGQGR